MARSRSLRSRCSMRRRRPCARTAGGTWELRVQLCVDIEKMPREDASVEWPQDLSPYVTVARPRARPGNLGPGARPPGRRPPILQPMARPGRAPPPGLGHARAPRGLSDCGAISAGVQRGGDPGRGRRQVQFGVTERDGLQRQSCKTNLLLILRKFDMQPEGCMPGFTVRSRPAARAPRMSAARPPTKRGFARLGPVVADLRTSRKPARIPPQESVPPPPPFAQPRSPCPPLPLPLQNPQQTPPRPPAPCGPCSSACCRASR